MFSRPSPAAGRLAGLVLLSVLTAISSLAQTTASGIIHGVTVGGGLSVYQGDLDRNPGNSPTQFVASSGLNLLAGVDRSFAGGRLGLEMHYNRLMAENDVVSGHHNVISLDVTYGRQIRSSAVHLFAGLGPSVILSSYDSQSVSASVLGLVNEGAGFDLTIPFGVVLQDRVRLSTRFALLDRIDGTDALGAGDLLTNISIAYRFAIVD